MKTRDTLQNICTKVFKVVCTHVIIVFPKNTSTFSFTFAFNAGKLKFRL